MMSISLQTGKPELADAQYSGRQSWGSYFMKVI